MRIFVALDIEDAVRERIARFMEGVQNFAPEARWVKPESLHVTLKFIGEKSVDEVEGIETALSSISGKATQMQFRGYGFFPSAKAARVFWIGIEADAELPQLAWTVDEAVSKLDITRDSHAYSPHLTLARGGRNGSGAPRRLRGDAPNQTFLKLQERLAKMSSVEFGALTAREFSLYESTMRHGGSSYTKLAGFPLSEGEGR